VVVPSPNWPDEFRPQQYTVPLVASPHVYPLRAARLENFSPSVAVTATGVYRSVVVPSPTCPYEFHPQQSAVPSVVTPQVWASPPAVMLVNTLPPLTATGIALSAVVPSPRIPEKFFPQQYATFDAVRAHACQYPAVMLANVLMPETGWGTAAPLIEPQQ